jgi:hypothetical protein
MTDSGNNFFGPRYGPTRVAKSFMPGQAGIAACDAALRDPLLTPELWMRRVTLLRARAVHDLSIGDTKTAFSDLDAAEAAAKDQSFLYQRGLKLGIDLVRAYALRQAGKQGEAETLAIKAWSSRPYERHVIISALTAIGPKGDRATFDTLLQAWARVEPEALSALYLEAYDAGRFDDATSMRDALLPRLEKSKGLYDEQLRDDAKNHYLWEFFWTERAGEKAYALAAAGKAQEAHAELAAAREHLQSLQPPLRKEPFRGTPLPPDAQWLQADQTLKTDGGRSLDRWTSLVDMRLDLADGHGQAVAGRVDASSLSPNGATIEFARAIAAALPKGAKPPVDPEALKKALAERRAAEFPSTLDVLYRSLPDVDGWPVLPQYKPLAQYTWNWRLGISGNGFTADPGKPEDSGGVIRFWGPSSSQMDLEEMALLRAADMARRIHRGVLVLNTAVRLHLRINMDAYGRQTGPAQEDGSEAELQVLFVDPANLPEKYRGTPWRVLNADQVYEALRPAYPSKE